MASINKRANGKWQAQVRTNGASRSKSFAMRKDAVAWARDVETQAERGGLHDTRALQSVLLEDVLQRYADEICIRKQAGQNERYAIIAMLRDRQLAQMRLDRLSEQVVARWRDQWLQRLAPASVCRYLGLIQHALEIARTEWRLPLVENPVRAVRRPKIDNHSDRRISDEERRRLLEAASECRNRLMRPLIVLAWSSAMRRGEMLALKRSDVIQRLRVCRVLTSKNGLPRTVPLTSEALGAIEDAMRLHNDTHVFPLTANAVQLAWRRIRERAGVPDLRFHQCRHEAISAHFERGLSLPEVALCSGHIDARTLIKRYTHLSAVHVAEKLD